MRGEDGFCVHTFVRNWHSGLDVILRGRSPGCKAAMEKSCLEFSLSFTTLSLSSFTSQVIEQARTLALILSVPIRRLNSASV